MTPLRNLDRKGVCACRRQSDQGCEARSGDTVSDLGSGDAVALHMTPEQIDVTLASFLPIDSTLIRGVLTAFRWFSPETIKTLRPVDSMESALQQALQALEAHGTPFTGDRQALRRALRLNA